jgi:fructokinase
MKNVYPDISVVCFGEILWDVLPTERKPGGAPMNVAYHLHKLGINSALVSSIGNDKPGADLITFLQQVNLSTGNVQINNSYVTSEVIATINASHEVSYEIVYPTAWDKITWRPQLAKLVSDAGAFVFGSLSSRDEVSRQTLLQLLDQAAYKVFDVNLRAPHYSVEIITNLLQKADMVKLNTAELMQIAGWYDNTCQTESDCVGVLLTKFNITEVLITKGGNGATYYTPAYRYDYPAYRISVADTIGSGDAFLAAFLSMKLRNEPAEIALDHAVAVGAFITSKAGACPEYSKHDLGHFIWKKKLATQTKFWMNEKPIAR